MDISIRVEHLLKRYSEEQILRAIVNSYKAIIDTETDEAASVEKSIKAIIDSETDGRAILEESADGTAKSASDTVEPVATCDHPPCGACGGSFFLRTGTCHVCQTCGTSQGCS